MRAIWLFLILIGLGFNVKAQTPSWWQLSDQNGLPSMLVYDITQDETGFIWLATEAGLYKYDGVSFNRYSCRTSKATAVGNLAIDSEGRIWCQNFSDQIFYVEHDSLKEFTIHQKDNVKRFIDFGIDENGVWIHSGDMDRIYNYAFESGKIRTFETPKWHSPFTFNYSAKNGTVLYFNDTIWQFNSQTEKLEISNEFIINPANTTLVDYTTFFSDGKNLLFSNYDNADVMLINESGSYKGKIQSKTKIHFLSVFQEDENTFWVGSSNGIFVYKIDPKTKNFNLEEHFFEGNYVTCIFKDSEGTIWLGTRRNGVILIPNSKVEIIDLKGENAVNPSISSLTSTHNLIILSTGNGETFIGNYKQPFTLAPPYSQYEITSIEVFQKDKILINNVLYQLPNFNHLFSYGCATVKEAHFYNGQLFFATGLGSYIGTYPPNNSLGTVNQIQKNRTRASELDTIKNIWYVGYANGLYGHYINKIDSFFEVKAGNNSLFANAIKLQSDGSLWVGTVGQGLFHLQLTNGEFDEYNEKNGLISNYINDIEEKNGELWVATTAGLQVINSKTNQIKNYTHFDGLSSSEVTEVSFLDDRVWLATAKNLMTFPSNLNPENKLAPKIYLNSCLYSEREISAPQNSEIPYNHDVITFTFTGLAFKSKGQFTYKYRTIGLDSNWHYSKGASNKVTLFALQPGKYEFQVLAINEDGVESENPATFKFRIETPFTKSNFYYTLIVFIIVAFTTIVALVRIRFIKRKNELENLKNRVELERAKLEQELRESQLASLKSQLNPHFIFNALNSIQEFILLKNTKEANRYLGKFADLMRITLELSNSSTCNLNDELKALNLYLELEGLRFEDSFEYQIIIAENINPIYIQIPSMLIQPYVENAIKHGLLHKKENRKLLVDFSLNYEKDALKVIIEDNGIGRHAADEINAMRNRDHKSFATNANKRRLEILNSERKDAIDVEILDLINENGKACGTKVLLNIPIKPY